MVDVKMEPSWKEVLKDELSAPYFERLTNAVKLEYKTNRCRKRIRSNRIP